MRKSFFLLVVMVLVFIQACKTTDNNVIPNIPPTITASDFTGSIDENSATGTSIGTIEATTSEGTLSYSINSQSPAGAVALDASTGEFTVADATIFDYETNKSVTGLVDIMNGDSTKQINFTININDVDETISTTITANDFTGSIDENSSSGTSIGTINATTNQGTLSYSIGSQSPAGAVDLNASNGEFTVADANIFDYETNTNVTGVVVL